MFHSKASGSHRDWTEILRFVFLICTAHFKCLLKALKLWHLATFLFLGAMYKVVNNFFVEYSFLFPLEQKV